jgi:AcrR family transcriptional regulator
VARSRATDIDALVHAAAAVFESRGYRNTTIDHIADAARVSRPTVYKYTRSKRELLNRMVDAVCDDLLEDFEAIIDGAGPAVERMRELIGLHVRSAIELRSFYAILFSEQVELSDQAKQRFHAFSQQQSEGLRGLLDECIALGPPQRSGLDTHIAANLVLSMLTSLYRWYDADGPVGRDSLETQILLVLEGVVPRKGSTETAGPA